MLSHKNSKAEKKSPWRWLLFATAVFFILADFLAASYLIFLQLYKNRIYPGVTLGELYLGGKTQEEAKKIIAAGVNEISQTGVKFRFEKNEATVMPIISSFSGDLARQVIAFDIDGTIDDAFAVGRGKDLFTNCWEQFNAMLKGQQIENRSSFSDEELKQTLKEGFGQFEQPSRNAELIATTTPNYWKKEIIFKITEEAPGFNFDYDSALEKMRANLKNLDNIPIEIIAVKGYPTIRRNECLNIEVQAQQFLDKADLVLTFEDKKWPVDKEEIAGWLILAHGVDNKVVIDLDAEKINKFLADKAPQIEINPTNARFQIKDGRVIEFAGSQDGQKINYYKTFESLRKNFLTDRENTVAIVVEDAKSEISVSSINKMGITEIIGTGHSNFAGSPKNRVHNINVGAAAMNGILIPPGEEFSTNKALGEVTAETGYLPEMTIMGDKTVPQYGGGLCQIGTTMFRAALASGFPITARQPHSYRVGYYEPAGTDATIYGPWPDLRFVNDSPDYVLIQTHISGNDLYFDFWGTKDGRIVEQTDPTIYNIVKPGPTKIIETLDLKPGEKKCTERAHNGADAYFDYKVTYPDETIKEIRFKSHYVPWREVCLLGVEKLSTSTLETVLE